MCLRRNPQRTKNFFHCPTSWLLLTLVATPGKQWKPWVDRPFSIWLHFLKFLPQPKAGGSLAIEKPFPRNLCCGVILASRGRCRSKLGYNSSLLSANDVISYSIRSLNGHRCQGHPTLACLVTPPQLPNPTRDWEKLLVFFQFHTTPRNQTSAKKIIDLLIQNNIVC